VARTNRRPPIGDAAVRVRMGPAHRRGSLVPQSQFSTLLLVVGASSGGVVIAAPDRPGEGEYRVDRQLLLHCGVTWQTHRTARLRGRSPRFVA
jgi:hypothetical protein